MLTFLIAAHASPPVDPSAVALTTWRASLPRSATSIEASVEPFRWAGGWRVRVRSELDGLPVDGASWVVAVNPDGSVARMTGRPLRSNAVPRGPVGEGRILERADDLAERLGRGRLWPARAQQVALVRGDSAVHAWRVDLSVAEPVGTWVAWFDAANGDLIGVRPTSRATTGRVFPVSPFHGPAELVDLEHLTSPFVLRGTYADSVTCRTADVAGGLFGVSECGETGRLAVPVNGGWPYLPAPGELDDPFQEVNLYHHVTQVAAWFDEHHGLRDAQPLQVISNFPLANAFYGDFTGDGRGDLAFGTVCDGCDGPGPEVRLQFGYDADVVYHEFAHWVVGRISDIPSLGADAYGLEWAGGSLNEGAADVFSMALTGDARVGEYAGRAFGEAAIRDLEPDRHCPTDLRGEVHEDGRILGAVGWNLIEAIGPELTAELLFGAVATWGPDIDWSIAGQSLVDAADDLRATGALDDELHTRAVEIIQASGMPGCGRVIPLDDGSRPDPFVLSAGLEGPLYRIPGGTQFSVELVPDADRLVIEVHDFQAPDGLGWSILARCGEPILNEPTTLAAFGLGFAVPTAWDWLLDGEATTGRLVIDADSEPPLPREGTCYIAVAGRDVGPLEPFAFTLGRVQFGAWSERGIAPPQRGCSTPGTTGAASVAWALILVVAWRRGRRGVPGGHPAG